MGASLILTTLQITIPFLCKFNLYTHDFNYHFCAFPAQVYGQGHPADTKQAGQLQQCAGAAGGAEAVDRLGRRRAIAGALGPEEGHFERPAPPLQGAAPALKQRRRPPVEQQAPAAPDPRAAPPALAQTQWCPQALHRLQQACVQGTLQTRWRGECGS
jgi:hypothetical protein